MGGCLDDSLAPSGAAAARLDVRHVTAQVSAGEKATVVIDVGYYRSTEELIPLPATPSRIAIDAGATISQPIVVTLDPCIEDPDAFHGGDEAATLGCFLEITFTLLDASDEEVSSATTFMDAPVVPGQTVELEDIVLSNIWSVEVAPLDTIAPEQSKVAFATAYTKAGAIVPDASFTWHSYDSTVAIVDSVSGVVTATGYGNAYIEARSGDVYGGTMVTVALGPSFDTGTPGGVCLTLDDRTTCPGEPHESPAALLRRKQP